jgi:hypothetical protein
MLRQANACRGRRVHRHWRSRVCAIGRKRHGPTIRQGRRRVDPITLVATGISSTSLRSPCQDSETAAAPSARVKRASWKASALRSGARHPDRRDRGLKWVRQGFGSARICSGEGRNRTATGSEFLRHRTAFRPRHQSTKLNSAPNACRIRPFCAFVKHSRQLAHSALLPAYYPSTTGLLALSLALAGSFHWHFHWHQHRRSQKHTCLNRTAIQGTVPQPR